MIRQLCIYMMVVLSINCLEAKIDLPAIFSNDMVLQRDKPIKIWGNCKYETKIIVTFNGLQKEAQIENGSFEVIFDALPAGGPYQLQVEGSQIIQIKDILIGDVFILGGQSNMEWLTKNIKDATKELDDANYPDIRLFKTPRRLSSQKSTLLDGSIWSKSNKLNAANYSAIGFLFGRNLHKKYEIPIGLIDNSWGGTDIKGWLPEEAFVGFPNYLEEITEYKNTHTTDVDFARVYADWAENMDLQDKGNFGGWGFPSTDRSGWAETQLPGQWEANGFPNYDGIMWYSRKFDAELLKNDSCTIALGKIGNEDLVYINGMAIGSTKGRNVFRKYKVPRSVLFSTQNEIVVRVKNTSWIGGFISQEQDLYCDCNGNRNSLSGTWKVKEGTPNYTKLPKEVVSNGYPTNRFNAMVYPLKNLSIKGYLYYQGESDASRHSTYGELFKRLIRLYRLAWGDHQMPFMYVQLANFGQAQDLSNPESNWAELRDAQSSALALPYTGMATAIDAGEGDDIHPKDKQTVADRLTLIAQNLCYGEQFLNINPTLLEVKINGRGTNITFKSVGEGLKRQDYTKKIDGLIAQDQSGVWRKVGVKILSANTISLDINFTPVKIKYLWSDNPENINLYNSADLPVLPFKWSSI